LNLISRTKSNKKREYNKFVSFTCLWAVFDKQDEKRPVQTMDEPFERRRARKSGSGIRKEEQNRREVKLYVCSHVGQAEARAKRNLLAIKVTHKVEKNQKANELSCVRVERLENERRPIGGRTASEERTGRGNLG
jgi:hypothetical protein